MVFFWYITVKLTLYAVKALKSSSGFDRLLDSVVFI